MIVIHVLCCIDAAKAFQLVLTSEHTFAKSMDEWQVHRMVQLKHNTNVQVGEPQSLNEIH